MNLTVVIWFQKLELENIVAKENKFKQITCQRSNNLSKVKNGSPQEKKNINK